MGITGISTVNGVSLGQETRLAGASGHTKFSNFSGGIPNSPSNVSLDVIGRDHFTPPFNRPQALYPDFIDYYRYLAVSGENCTVNITYPTTNPGWRIVSGTGTSATSTYSLGYPTSSGEHEELQFRAVNTYNYPSVSVGLTNVAYGTVFRGWFWCNSDWTPTSSPQSYNSTYTVYTSQSTTSSYSRLKAVCS